MTRVGPLPPSLPPYLPPHPSLPPPIPPSLPPSLTVALQVTIEWTTCHKSNTLAAPPKQPLQRLVPIIPSFRTIRGANLLGSNHSQIYPHIRAKFDRGPTAVSKKGDTNRHTDTRTYTCTVTRTDTRTYTRTDTCTDSRTKGRRSRIVQVSWLSQGG